MKSPSVRTFDDLSSALFLYGYSTRTLTDSAIVTIAFVQCQSHLSRYVVRATFSILEEFSRHNACDIQYEVSINEYITIQLRVAS